MPRISDEMLSAMLSRVRTRLNCSRDVIETAILNENYERCAEEVIRIKRRKKIRTRLMRMKYLKTT